MLSKRSVVTNLKKSLETFLKDELAAFNTSYENIEFTRLAFCFDPYECSFSFSMNTRFDQNKAVLIYSNHDIDFVKTNPKHWRYQDIAIIDILEKEHFDAYFADDIDELYELIKSELKKFMNSHVFKALKRSSDFKASFVSEHPFNSVYL